MRQYAALDKNVGKNAARGSSINAIISQPWFGKQISDADIGPPEDNFYKLRHFSLKNSFFLSQELSFLEKIS